jgi:hypothetical protein
VGDFAARSMGMLNAARQGELPEDINDIPFLRKFYGQNYPYEDIGAFRENLKEVKITKKEWETSETLEEAAEYADKNEAVLALAPQGAEVYRFVRKANEYKDLIEASENLPEDEKEALLQKLDDQMLEQIKLFNKAYREAQKNRGELPAKRNNGDREPDIFDQVGMP